MHFKLRPQPPWLFATLEMVAQLLLAPGQQSKEGVLAWTTELKCRLVSAEHFATSTTKLLNGMQGISYPHYEPYRSTVQKLSQTFWRDRAIVETLVAELGMICGGPKFTGYSQPLGWHPDDWPELWSLKILGLFINLIKKQPQDCFADLQELERRQAVMRQLEFSLSKRETLLRQLQTHMGVITQRRPDGTYPGSDSEIDEDFQSSLSQTAKAKKEIKWGIELIDTVLATVKEEAG